MVLADAEPTELSDAELDLVAGGIARMPSMGKKGGGSHFVIN